MDIFPFIRVTVLGSQGCGKTALINSFVNNTAPTERKSTIFPELYYRFVRLLPESDRSGPITPVCIEIEDTVAPDMFTENEESQSDISQVQKIEYFLDLSSKKLESANKGTDFTPFNLWKPPKTTIFPERIRYSPLTHARMAFLIVFDSNDRNSLDIACQIHSMLMDSLDLQKVTNRPYIAFVANKIDLNHTFEESGSIIEFGEDYTQRIFVRLAKISALTSKGIQKLFLDLLYIVVGNQVLWDLRPKQGITAYEQQ